MIAVELDVYNFAGETADQAARSMVDSRDIRYEVAENPGPNIMPVIRFAGPRYLIEALLTENGYDNDLDTYEVDLRPGEGERDIGQRCAHMSDPTDCWECRAERPLQPQQHCECGRELPCLDHRLDSPTPLQLVREVAGSGVEFDHPALDHVVIHVDRDTWNECQRVFAREESHE